MRTKKKGLLLRPQNLELLLQARKNKGLTYAQLAKQVGIAWSRLMEIEKGRIEMDAPLAKKLGRIFRVDPRLFLTDSSSRVLQ